MIVIVFLVLKKAGHYYMRSPYCEGSTLCTLHNNVRVFLVENKEGWKKNENECRLLKRERSQP